MSAAKRYHIRLSAGFLEFHTHGQFAGWEQ